MLEKVAKTLILCLVVAKQVMSPHYSGVVLGLSFMNLYEYQGLKWIRQMSRQFLFPHPKHFWFLFRQENNKLKQGQYEILFVGKNDGKDRSLFWAWIKDLSEIVPVNISFRAAFLLLLGTSSWGSLPPRPQEAYVHLQTDEDLSLPAFPLSGLPSSSCRRGQRASSWAEQRGRRTRVTGVSGKGNTSLQLWGEGLVQLPQAPVLAITSRPWRRNRDDLIGRLSARDCDRETWEMNTAQVSLPQLHTHTSSAFLGLFYVTLTLPKQLMDTAQVH